MYLKWVLWFWVFPYLGVWCFLILCFDYRDFSNFSVLRFDFELIESLYLKWGLCFWVFSYMGVFHFLISCLSYRDFDKLVQKICFWVDWKVYWAQLSNLKQRLIWLADLECMWYFFWLLYQSGCCSFYNFLIQLQIFFFV